MQEYCLYFWTLHHIFSLLTRRLVVHVRCFQDYASVFYVYYSYLYLYCFPLDTFFQNVCIIIYRVSCGTKTTILQITLNKLRIRKSLAITISVTEVLPGTAVPYLVGFGRIAFHPVVYGLSVCQAGLACLEPVEESATMKDHVIAAPGAKQSKVGPLCKESLH